LGDTISMLFENVIGQSDLKKTLALYVNAFHKGEVFPCVLLNSAPGAGKTTFCRELARELGKPLVEINASRIKTVKQLVNQVFREWQGKEVTFFIDEAHALSKPVETFLLSAIPTGSQTSVTVNYSDADGNDGPLTFDYSLMTIFMATTEKHEMFKPLVDRLYVLTFEEYNKEQLASIIERNLGFPLLDCAKEFLPKYCRGNARSAAKLGVDLRRYCIVNDISEVDELYAEIAVDELGLFLYGLNSEELKTLKIIADHPNGITITQLKAKTNLNMNAQRDVESFLLRNSLINVKGIREVTNAGRRYIDSLKK